MRTNSQRRLISPPRYEEERETERGKKRIDGRGRRGKDGRWKEGDKRKRKRDLLPALRPKGGRKEPPEMGRGNRKRTADSLEGKGTARGEENFLHRKMFILLSSFYQDAAKKKKLEEKEKSKKGDEEEQEEEEDEEDGDEQEAEETPEDLAAAEEFRKVRKIRSSWVLGLLLRLLLASPFFTRGIESGSKYYFLLSVPIPLSLP